MNYTDIQRLSFIKYILTIGLEQSNKPEPLCGISILQFHDSVELFLQLIFEKVGGSKKDIRFMKYWEEIDNKLKNKNLTQKEIMRKLNDARANLKHVGIIPSKLNVEVFKESTLDFFNENCLLVFNINFEEITLIEIIKYKRTRELLKEANDYYNKNQLEESLQSIALSFEYLLLDYEETKKDKFGHSLFEARDRFRFLSSFHFKSIDRELSEFVNGTIASIKEIQEIVKLLGFGIDYKKYIKFKSIIPMVIFTADVKPHFENLKGENFNKNDLDFCINFIVETSLKLQEFDFEYKQINR